MIRLSTIPQLKGADADTKAAEIRSYLYSIVEEIQRQTNAELEELKSEIAALESEIESQ